MHNKPKTVIELIGMGSKKYGGLEKFIVEECRQLNKQNIHLHVVFTIEPICREYVNNLLELGATYSVIPGMKRKDYIREIDSLYDKFDVIAVHKNFGWSNIWAIWEAKKRNIKYRICTEHCLPEMWRPGALVYNNVEMTLCTRKLCVSNATCKRLKKWLPLFKSKIQTEYLGVEDFHFDRNEIRHKYKQDSDTIYIANVAYHNPVKGVDVLLKAVKILIDKYPQLKFKLLQIGGGQNPQQTQALKELEKSLGIENYIEWCGVINNVPERLSVCDIYVQPSRSEGIPLSIMEASLAGIPTVATRVGGIVESVKDGETGLLCRREDPETLAKLLYELIINKEKREKMGSTAREHALRNFSIKENVKKLLGHYGLN